MNTITCPNCKANVTPAAEGTCPHCHAVLPAGGKPVSKPLGVLKPGEFDLLSEAPPVRPPDFCPNCSSPADRPTSILSYQYEYDGGTTILFGIFGQLIRFLLLGAASHVLLNVNLCADCQRKSRLFKALEWASRILGFALIPVVIAFFSLQPELNPFKKGIGPLLVAFSPLVLGAILSVVFRNLSEKSKGFAFVGADDQHKRFHVQSADWRREFTRRQEIIVREELELEQDEDVLAFYRATVEAWAAGQLDHLNPIYRSEGKTMDARAYMKKHPPYEGTSLRAFFKQFKPRPGEFLVALGPVWFVLTNTRLVQKDGRDNAYREVLLAEIDTYELQQQKKTVSLLFKLRSGQQTAFELVENYPLQKIVSGLIAKNSPA